MFHALHGNARAQHIAEHLEFRATKTLTCRGRGADRAVIFQQQEAVGVGAPFGQVAFARPELCQSRHADTQCPGPGECGAVGASGFLFAHAYELFQRRLSQRRADRVDEAHGKLGMRIREAILRGRRQMPVARRPTDAVLLDRGFHQAIVCQLHQMLPRRFGRRAEHRGDVCRTQRATPFDQAEDPVNGGGIFQAHACILRRGGTLRKTQNQASHPLQDVRIDGYPAPGTDR